MGPFGGRTSAIEGLGHGQEGMGRAGWEDDCRGRLVLERGPGQGYR